MTVSVQRAERSPASGPRTASVASGVSDAMHTRWQAQLDEGLQALASAGTQCREVCRASGDICVAAHEICALEGGDERCRRARRACEQATHQRDTQCPVCPAL
jgi:hypothetical protein